MNDHSAWYYLVILIALVTLYFAWKRRDPRLLGLYVFAGGITYLFEYIVLVLFNSYEYDPGILANPYFDNLAGAVVSDAFSVPMTASLVGVLQLTFFRYLPFVLLLVGCEWLFLRLQIYTHHWWQLGYTAAGLIIHFEITKYWTRKLSHPSFLIRFFTLASGCMLIYSSLLYVLVAFLHPFYYQVGWFEHSTRDHVAFATFDVLIQTPLFVWIVIKRNWIASASVLLVLFPLFDWFLIKKGVLHLSDDWSLLHFVGMRLVVVLLILAFDHNTRSDG